MTEPEETEALLTHLTEQVVLPRSLRAAPSGRRAAPDPPRRLALAGAALLAAGVTALAVLPHHRNERTSPVTPAPATSLALPDHLLWGYHDVRVPAIEQATGRPFDLVAVRDWPGQNAPNQDQLIATGHQLLVGIAPLNGTPPFSDIAAGTFDTQLKTDLAALDGEAELTYVTLALASAQPAGSLTYLAAWKHLRSLARSIPTRHLQWVWTVHSELFSAGRADDFYPGDSDVDWIGISAKTDAACAGAPPPSLEQLVHPALEWATRHPSKPIMLARWAAAETPALPRAQWLQDAATFLAAHSTVIRAAVYGEDEPPGASCQVEIDSSADSLRTFAEIGHTRPFTTSRT